MPDIFTTSIDKLNYDKIKSRKRGVLQLDKPSKCSEGDLIFLEDEVNKERLKTKVITYVDNHSVKIAVVETY